MTSDEHGSRTLTPFPCGPKPLNVADELCFVGGRFQNPAQYTGQQCCSLITAYANSEFGGTGLPYIAQRVVETAGLDTADATTLQQAVKKLVAAAAAFRAAEGAAAAAAAGSAAQQPPPHEVEPMTGAAGGGTYLDLGELCAGCVASSKNNCFGSRPVLIKRCTVCTVCR